MKFDVEIVARGEGLIYKDDTCTVHFNCGRNSQKNRFEVDIYKYSDNNFHDIKLPEDKEKQVLKNISIFFKKKNEQVYFIKNERNPILKTADELLEERLNRRS
jgi:hypothetical protein